MIFIILNMIFLWLFCGNIATFCAMSFLEKSYTLEKILIGMLRGPFSVNKEWWLK